MVNRERASTWKFWLSRSWRLTIVSTNETHTKTAYPRLVTAMYAKHASTMTAKTVSITPLAPPRRVLLHAPQPPLGTAPSGRVDALQEPALRVAADELVDEADVLENLRRTVARNRVRVSEDGDHRLHGIEPEAPECALGCHPHPPVLIGEEAGDRGSGLDPDDVSDRTCGMCADEPLGILEAGEQGGADLRALSGSRASAAAARTFASTSHVSATSPSPRARDRAGEGSPPRTVRPDLLRRSGTSLGPGAGARRSSSVATRERGPCPIFSAPTSLSTAHSSPSSPRTRIAALEKAGSGPRPEGERVAA